jgi:hypothetical protein
VKKPVSRFAFRVHNLQRYTAAQVAGDMHCPPYADIADLAFYLSANHPPGYTGAVVAHAVGLCRLNQVDP